MTSRHQTVEPLEIAGFRLGAALLAFDYGRLSKPDDERSSDVGDRGAPRPNRASRILSGANRWTGLIYEVGDANLRAKLKNYDTDQLRSLDLALHHVYSLVLGEFNNRRELSVGWRMSASLSIMNGHGMVRVRPHPDRFENDELVIEWWGFDERSHQMHLEIGDLEEARREDPPRWPTPY
jgi:hypothetical protein